jgi:hypothetical protein
MRGFTFFGVIASNIAIAGYFTKICQKIKA